VTFQLNDALIKDKALAGVDIRVTSGSMPDGGDPATVFEGTTDRQGRLQAPLAAGSYAATYQKPGYVSIEGSPLTVRAAGQLITTSLTPILESGASRQRIVRVVLNWGSDSSQVKDADAHLAPQGGPADAEVYFSEKRFDGPDGFSIELDVDDMDWGGPETITLTEPPPGSYLYWVHNYSDDSSLGASEVVVRVFFDDRLTGEYRAPKAAEQRYFRPFQAIVVDAESGVSVREFDGQAMVAGAHLAKPPGPWTDPGSLDCDGCDGLIGVVVFGLIFLWIAAGFARRRR
jgi:hypothetical protein